MQYLQYYSFSIHKCFPVIYECILCHFLYVIIADYLDKSMHFIFGSIAKLKVRSVLWIYVIFFVHFYLGSVNVLNNHLCVFKNTIWMWMPVMETKETVLQYPSQNSWLKAKLSYWILTTTCMEKMLEACFCRFVWSFLLFLYQFSSICHP